MFTIISTVKRHIFYLFSTIITELVSLCTLFSLQVTWPNKLTLVKMVLERWILQVNTVVLVLCSGHLEYLSCATICSSGLHYVTDYALSARGCVIYSLIYHSCVIRTLRNVGYVNNCAGGTICCDCSSRVRVVVMSDCYSYISYSSMLLLCVMLSPPCCINFTKCTKLM